MENVDTPIAISMGMLAGLLAVVSMFGNKASGDMVTFQAQANNLQAQANMSRTKATDTWSYFQAKTLRKHMYKIGAHTLRGRSKRELKEDWLDTSRRYHTEASALKTRAMKLDDLASELQDKANKKMHRSSKANKKAETLDLSRLGAEIGLVLCSLALVSKRRYLWVLGLISGAASFVFFLLA